MSDPCSHLGRHEQNTKWYSFNIYFIPQGLPKYIPTKFTGHCYKLRNALVPVWTWQNLPSNNLMLIDWIIWFNFLLKIKIWRKSEENTTAVLYNNSKDRFSYTPMNRWRPQLKISSHTSIGVVIPHYFTGVPGQIFSWRFWSKTVTIDSNIHEFEGRNLSRVSALV